MSAAAGRTIRRRGSGAATAHSVAAQRLVDAIGQKQDGDHQEPALRRAVENVVRTRERKELVDLELRRGIFALSDLGLSQRKIATIVGISQPEVSRRLKRRSLTPTSVSPREIILRRSSGELSTDQMIAQLRTLAMTSTVPGAQSAYDGAATITGTAKQLITALYDGLISEREYEAVRTGRSTARVDKRRQ